jgi:hypothetical protein
VDKSDVTSSSNLKLFEPLLSEFTLLVIKTCFTSSPHHVDLRKILPSPFFPNYVLIVNWIAACPSVLPTRSFMYHHILPTLKFIKPPIHNHPKDSNLMIGEILENLQHSM